MGKINFGIGSMMSPVTATALMVTFGLTCLVFGVYLAWQIGSLQYRGHAAHGVVDHIDVGIKGLRTAVVRYTTGGGETHYGRDIHQTQFFSPGKVGQQVRLHYDPDKPERIMILRGAAIWLTPMAFLAGAFIAVLAARTQWRIRRGKST